MNRAEPFKAIQSLSNDVQTDSLFCPHKVEPGDTLRAKQPVQSAIYNVLFDLCVNQLERSQRCSVLLAYFFSWLHLS